MSTLVTILRPTVQLGMNSWLDLRPLEIPTSGFTHYSFRGVSATA